MGKSKSNVERLNTLPTDLATLGAALSTKQDMLISGVNIKTINGQAVTGSGDLVVSATGAVTSVAGKTGDVTLAPSDVGAEPADATILKSAAIGVTVQGTLISGVNIKTINGQAVTGSGDLVIAGGGGGGSGDVVGPASATDGAVALFDGATGKLLKVGSVTQAKAAVGLSNVDDTSDAAKPVSTATQNALNAKAPVSHTHDASAIVSGTIADAQLPGRLREVAASITDWNDAQSNGWYMAGDAANAPIPNLWFVGSVENHRSDDWCTQVVHAFSTDSEGDTKTYRRELNNGTWGAWQRCRITEAEQAAVTQSWWNSTAISISKVTGLQSALDAKAPTTTPTITGLREVRAALPTDNIDLATGNVFTKTISAATTLTVSNVPAAGAVASFILELTNPGTNVTFWAGVKWPGGTAPTLTAAGVDVLGFYTHDGGATWRGMVLAKDSK